MNYPQQFVNSILDTVFPAKCINCGKIIEVKSGYICKKCIGLIEINKKFECIGCKNRVLLGETCNRCKEFLFIDKILVAASYREPMISLIKTLKYRFVVDASYAISMIIKKYLSWLAKRGLVLNNNAPIIIPVPLHYKRLNWRGFNQAEILATDIGEKIQCPIEKEVIVRIVGSKPQAEIENHEERINNLGDDFVILEKSKGKIIGKDIILVDDVCTTGTTLNKCAKILKYNGAKKITAFVIARG